MELSVCYYPEHWNENEWENDIKKMKEIGISSVRIFEFTWALVEKEEGVFDFSLLNKAMDLLEKHHMNVVLCTPTAAPPPWLVTNYPETRLYNTEHIIVTSGVRRNYSFSSEKFLELSKKIVEAFAKNFKDYTNIIAWQMDNEYGAPDGLDRSQVALKAFREWLKAKYKTIDNLNEAWGTKSLGLLYDDWDDIEHLPRDHRNPAQALDYYRRSAEAITAYNKEQVKIVRKYYKDTPLTTNFMGTFPYANQFEMMKDLDVLGLDTYPIALLSHMQNRNKIVIEDPSQLRRGVPEIQGLRFDLSRSTGKGKFWIMELQPGPVNWGIYNLIPQDGAVRLWAIDALSHGAERITPFRWRQCLVGAEQLHSGLCFPNGEKGQGAIEYTKVWEDMKKLKQANYEPKHHADVAFIYDYDSTWAYMSQSLSKEESELNVFTQYYNAFLKWGVNMDFANINADLNGYKIVVVSQSLIANPELVSALKNFKGKIIFAPRSLSKDTNFNEENTAELSGLKEIIDVEVLQLETLPGNYNDLFTYNNDQYPYSLYKEDIKSSENVIANFTSVHHGKSSPAIVENDKAYYVACGTDQNFLTTFIKNVLDQQKVATLKQKLPEYVKIRFVNGFIFILNYSAHTFDVTEYLTDNYEDIVGNASQIPSADLAIAKIHP